MRSLTVAKFGGSSVQDKAAILRCLKILARDKNSQIVVVSALKGVTNKLEKCAELAACGHFEMALHFLEQIHQRHLTVNSSLCEELECLMNEAIGLLELIHLRRQVLPKLMDQLYSIGERSSAYLFSEFARSELDRNIMLLDARKIIRTDDHFRQANPLINQITSHCQKLILPLVQDPNCLIITQGFIASNEQGETTTLGREGSDYSAALIAAGCNAKLLKIWTDVPGIASADPRLVNRPCFMPEMSYAEAALLAEKGANVLHPKTLWPVVSKNIPLVVGPTCDPLVRGTLIHNSSPNCMPLQALTLKKDLVRVTLVCIDEIPVTEFFGQAFQILATYDFQLEWNACTDSTLSFVIANSSLTEDLVQRLQCFCRIELKKHQSIMTLIGHRLQKNADLQARIHGVFTRSHSQIYTIGEGEDFISFLVPEVRGRSIISQLHEEFIESRETQASSLGMQQKVLGVAQ